MPGWASLFFIPYLASYSGRYGVPVGKRGCVATVGVAWCGLFPCLNAASQAAAGCGDASLDGVMWESSVGRALGSDHYLGVVGKVEVA